MPRGAGCPRTRTTEGSCRSSVESTTHLLTASARLSKKVELIRPALGLPGRLLIEHPRARDVYPDFLTVSYQLAIGIIHLMESALERARVLVADDPVAAGLEGYLERHISEEMHGDEPGAGLAADLIAIGADESRLRAQPPPPKVAAAIGMVFFSIHHVHPVAILGSLELEAHQADTAQVEQLIRATGLPRAGFGQLLLHAELDVAHADELHRLIDSLPLEPWHEQLIGLSALQTMSLAIDALLDVVGADGLSGESRPGR